MLEKDRIRFFCGTRAVSPTSLLVSTEMNTFMASPILTKTGSPGEMFPSNCPLTGGPFSEGSARVEPSLSQPKRRLFHARRFTPIFRHWILASVASAGPDGFEHYTFDCSG